MNMRRNAAILALVGGATLLGTTGCVNYASYPAAPGSIAIRNPNTPAVEEVMMAGLRWTANRYPPAALPSELDEQSGPRMVINLPPGVRGLVYERVANVIPGAEPLSPENSHLPIYHVASIRIRGDQAQLDVFRPVQSVGLKPTGETVYQEIRIDLKGGLQPWRVVNWREWTPGSGETPALNYFTPEPPRPREGPRVGGFFD